VLRGFNFASVFSDTNICSEQFRNLHIYRHCDANWTLWRLCWWRR